jgi:hypothetical protein
VPTKLADVHVKDNALFGWDIHGDLHHVGSFDDDKEAWEEVLKPTGYITSPYVYSIGCRLKAMNQLAPFDLAELLLP